MFRIKVPATSANMGPAFDTAGVALSLYNTVEVFTRDEKNFDGDFHIESVNNIDERIRAGQTIPTDERNLLYRTVKEFEKTTGKKVPPFYFKQTGACFKKGERVYHIERKDQEIQAAKANVNFRC